MVKAQRDIEKDLKLIDIVIEVLDARIPISSQNPNIHSMIQNKEKVLLLNKYDLADMDSVMHWKKTFESEGFTVILTNAYDSKDITRIIQTIKSIGERKYKNINENKSINIIPIYRVIVLGIPNVGKSTIINKISGKESVSVKNMPGVTRKNQWIRIENNIELLDTPGLLWPRLDDKNAGIKLALTGNIKQEIIDTEELAIEGIKFLLQNEKYMKMLVSKYGLDDIDKIIGNKALYDNEESETTVEIEIINAIGKRRGCLIKGGEIDFLKASNLFLDDLKNGKIGKISFE